LGFSVSDGSEGVEEEKKGANRNGPSAYARFEKVEYEAAAAAMAAKEDNFDAAITRLNHKSTDFKIYLNIEKEIEPRALSA
jgi:hypothetical protein